MYWCYGLNKATDAYTATTTDTVTATNTATVAATVHHRPSTPFLDLNEVYVYFNVCTRVLTASFGRTT